jgi:hypothetical protein
MGRVMQPHRSENLDSSRTGTQKACIGLGIVFVLIGLVGVVMPAFLGMHLSFSHNFIHLITGSLAIWVGYADEPRKASIFSIALGVLFGFLGAAGFIFGKVAYPGVGQMGIDQNLMRLVPNVLEFGTSDHIFHLITSAGFILATMMSKSKFTNPQRT